MPLPPAWATVGVGDTGVGVGDTGVGVWETAVGTDPPPLGGATVDAGARHLHPRKRPLTVGRQQQLMPVS